jgi:hypothetical protein
MRILASIGGIALIAATLLDGFNTMVLPRRVRRIFRLTSIFYRFTWSAFSRLGRRIGNGARREEYLSVYGPLSILMLLVCWVAALIVGFGMLHYALLLQLGGRGAGLAECAYVSASSLFMIASEEPTNVASKWLVTVEAGLGFGLLGVVVGYLPVLYQSYSSRELRISMLDARAGSPPAASELLLRQAKKTDKLEQQLATWEEWTAELLQEQLSYPMLAYFRSQHQNQSWLAALTALLDSSAIVLLCSDEDLKRQAYLTFAIGRHALVDLATVFRAKPIVPRDDRLNASDLGELRTALEAGKTCLRVEDLQEERLARLRDLYEPYANSLSLYFLMALPSWRSDPSREDNWLATTWDHPGGPFAASDPFSSNSEEPASQENDGGS